MLTKDHKQSSIRTQQFFLQLTMIHEKGVIYEEEKQNFINISYNRIRYDWYVFILFESE